MTTAVIGVSSEAKSLAYHKNRIETQKTFSTIQPEIPDLTFMAKGELRRMIEDLCRENARLMNQRIEDLEAMNEQKNKILNQQEEILGLYSKLNTSGPSPLRVAG